jgi:hypothetical protein
MNRRKNQRQNKKQKTLRKFNILEDKLVHNRIRPHGHILRMNEEKITKKILNMELKGRCPRGRLRS